ncbi:MAG: hypothetical protein DRP86_07495 [Candidatus Neomarinimicrobiota bacterium]|nr:MAG: hypothetical protein DRP86_07495 [Candidatus Neomarinimicrobiota bacterium]
MEKKMTESHPKTAPLVSRLKERVGLQEERLKMLYSLGGEDILKKILHTALDNMIHRGDGLDKSLDEKDWDTVHKLAHSIKSSAGNIGALDVMALARIVEETDLPDPKKVRELGDKIRILHKQIKKSMDMS